jgi:hypothetical protein
MMIFIPERKKERPNGRSMSTINRKGRNILLLLHHSRAEADLGHETCVIPKGVTPQALYARKSPLGAAITAT